MCINFNSSSRVRFRERQALRAMMMNIVWFFMFILYDTLSNFMHFLTVQSGHLFLSFVQTVALNAALIDVAVIVSISVTM